MNVNFVRPYLKWMTIPLLKSRFIDEHYVTTMNNKYIFRSNGSYLFMLSLEQHKSITIDIPDMFVT